MNKPLLGYPLHPEFEELLNSCGSMTRQLEALGQLLTVSVLYAGIVHNELGQEEFQRCTVLKLNEHPVVVACSCAKLSEQFFAELLQAASTTPIGKFLFANPLVKRRDSMTVELIVREQIRQPELRAWLTSYSPQQMFWQRNSCFDYQDEQLELCEIILPEFEQFERFF